MWWVICSYVAKEKKIRSKSDLVPSFVPEISADISSRGIREEIVRVRCALGILPR